MTAPKENEWLDLAELAETAVWVDAPEAPPRLRWKLINTQRGFDVTFRIEKKEER